GIWTPLLSATILTASGNEQPSIFMTKSKTLPNSPAETFVKLLGLADVKARRLFVMKRAAGGVVAALLFQSDVIRNDPHDVGLITQLIAETARDSHNGRGCQRKLSSPVIERFIL